MCGCQDNKEYRFGGNIDETSIRLQYANEDIELLEKSYSGAMSITDTKHGLLDLNYNKGTKIYEIYNKGNKLYSGDRNGAIDFIADSFIIEYDDEQEGIDLFEDYENIPEEVQAILDEYQTAFEDGDYKGLEQAHKELERIGYTFDYYLDGQAYDLRPIGTKGKVELESEKFDKEHPKFQEGGSIDSERRFTEFDFNKLMDGEGFRAIWSGYVWEIYPEGGGKVLGKFNPKTKKLFIIGKKDLSNTLVEYLQQNSYVSNEEYFKLENGGGVLNPYSFDITAIRSGGEKVNQTRVAYAENEELATKKIKNFLSEKLGYKNIEIHDIRKGHEGIPHLEYANGGSVEDWFWNYAYRHYLRDASLSQRNKVKSEFIKRGLELDGESPEHAYIVVSIVKPEDLKYFNKISDNAIEYEIGGTLSLPSFASEGISADRFKERQKAFVGYLGDVISIQIAETFLGRKINSWEDDIIIIGDTKYKKIYLKPEYKRIN